MSGDAIDRVKDAQLKARQWDDCRRELMILETQVISHGLVLTGAGDLPMHTDLDWILASIETIDQESLR